MHKSTIIQACKLLATMLDEATHVYDRPTADLMIALGDWVRANGTTPGEAFAIDNMLARGRPIRQRCVQGQAQEAA